MLRLAISNENGTEHMLVFSKKNHRLLQDAFICKFLSMQNVRFPGPGQPESILAQNDYNAQLRTRKLGYICFSFHTY